MKKAIYLLLAAAVLSFFSGCPIEVPGTDKAISEFGFKNVNPFTVTITGAAIEVTVSYGTDVTALIATFISTGLEVAVAGTLQVSGETVNDFSSPVTYTVTAEDGSTYDFTVIVTLVSSDKEFVFFSFLDADNYDLSSDIDGEISGKRIILKVPYETVLTSLIGTFISSGENIEVDGILQTSGGTANDFSDTVVYTVTAEDGSSSDYEVDVLMTVNITQLDDLIGENSELLERLDTSEIADMSQLFNNRSTSRDISAWDVSNVTDMHGMFYGALSFNQDISAWDVSNVTNMQSMFQTAHAFNKDLSGWDVSKVENMGSMFNTALVFNQDISGWDVGSVTSYSQFAYQSALSNEHIPPTFR
jgi:surface protein